jgi:hypothetical protein
LKGARGRDHSASGRRRHQQRVVEEIAKPRKLGGERRLADIQPHGRSRYIRLFDQHVKRDEQVEVGPLEINHVYRSHKNDQFL